MSGVYTVNGGSWGTYCTRMPWEAEQAIIISCIENEGYRLHLFWLIGIQRVISLPDICYPTFSLETSLIYTELDIVQPHLTLT